MIIGEYSKRIIKKNTLAANSILNPSQLSVLNFITKIAAFECCCCFECRLTVRSNLVCLYLFYCEVLYINNSFIINNKIECTAL